MTSRAFRRKPKAGFPGLHANRSSISAAFTAILCSSSRPSLLPRDSGEGGPSEREAIGWWKGRGPRRKFFRRQRNDESDAPSTTLRVVPLPRYRGGGKTKRSQSHGAIFVRARVFRPPF